MSAALGPQAETQVLSVADVWAPTAPRLPRVDLLPVEVRQARRLRATQRALAAGGVVLLLVLAGATALARSTESLAREDLARAQARSAALAAEQAEYAEVAAVQQQLDTVGAAREQAMAGDVRWAPYLDEISGRAPAGVWLQELSVVLAPSATAAGLPAEASDPLAAPSLATVTLTGSGGSYEDVAAWLDGLADVPGFADPRYSIAQRTGTEERPVVEFTSTVGVVPDALSHRFDRKGD